MSGYKETKELGKYMEVPLNGRNPKKKDTNHIITSIKYKLTGWKAQHLSFACRTTLAKVVIKAIPMYVMIMCSLPKECVNKIHKLQRDFIWEDKNDQNHIHVVKWSIIMQPKHMRGMGFGNLVHMNKTRLSKLWWKLISENNSIWCHV